MDGADCYIVKGFFSVFAEGYESMREVENAVLPVVRESMQSDELLSASDLLIGVDYIGTDLVDRVPTSAPNGAPSPTVPNPPVPTSAPNSDPSPTLAPNLSPSSTSAPTRSLWPTWSETEFPTSSNRGPTLSPTTFAPTSPTPTAPLAPSPSGPVAPPSSQNSTDIVTDESKEGLDKMVWWMWLLVGIGAAVSLLFCIGVLFGRSSRGPSKRAVRSDDGTDPTHIGTLSKFEQSRQEYIPPGEQMDTFHISPSKRGNIEELDESQEESTDDQDEGADEEGGFGFSYGDEDARENDAVVEYEDEEDEDVDFRGSRRTSANNLENKDQFGDQDQFDDQEQFDDENIFEDEGTYEPDGDVYDDGKTYEDEGDDGDYEEYEEDGEVYDDEDVYEDEEYDEEADDEEYEEEGDEDYVEGEEEVYQEEEGELSYDEESYYTEEVEEEGPRWDSSFQVDRTNSL